MFDDVMIEDTVMDDSIIASFGQMSVSRPIQRRVDSRVVEKPPLSIIEMFSPALLVEVLHHLPYLYIIRCRALCRTIRKIIDQSPILQLAIELGAAGYYRTYAKLPASAVLNKFRAFQRIYRNPQLHEVQKIDLDPICDAAYKHRDPDWDSDSAKKQRYGDYLVCQTPQMENLIMLVDVIYLGTDPQRLSSPADRMRTFVFYHTWEVAGVEPDEELLVMRDSDRELHKDTLYFLSLRDGNFHPKRPQSVVIPNLIAVHSVVSEWILLSTPGPVEIMQDDKGYTVLYHWPSGVVNWVWPLQGKPPYTEHGCLIGRYALIPMWSKSEEDKSWGGCVSVWLIPPLDDLEFVPYHMGDFEVERHDDEDGVFHGFSVTPLQNSRMRADNKRGFAADQAMVLLSWSNPEYEYYVPLSTFLPNGDMYGTDGFVPEKTYMAIYWDGWSFSRAYEDWCEPNPDNRDYFEVAGLRFFFPDMIADLNQYDMLNNIYNVDSVSKLRGGKASVDESQLTISYIGTSFDDLEPRDLEEPDQAAYRLIPYDGRDESSTSTLHMIEEDDGPKIVEIEWLGDADPTSMTIWAMTESTESITNPTKSFMRCDRTAL